MKPERVIIAVVAFALLLGVIWLDWALDTHAGSLVVITAVGVLALAELYRLLARVGVYSDHRLGTAAAALLFLARGAMPWAGVPSRLEQPIVLFLLAAAVALPFVGAILSRSGARDDGREELLKAAGTVFGLLYVWLFWSFLLELRLVAGGPSAESTRKGLQLALVLVLSVKIGDSAAYLVGRTIGKTPLSWVSPKKTWEGAAGAVVGAAAVSAASAPLFGFDVLDMLVFGVVSNLAGQIGDLSESLVKRRTGVKDSGGFLREIGGFLDLTDSLLYAAPAAYLLALLLAL